MLAVFLLYPAASLRPVLVLGGGADIEWKITYVGAAEDERYDQILDTVLVGPVPVGCNKFVFEVRRRAWWKLGFFVSH